MPYKIQYIVGDVRNHEFEGTRVIPHVCNDINRMGAGVAKALYTKWPTVKTTYHSLDFDQPTLGIMQLVYVEKKTLVCNMIGQHKIMVKKSYGIPVNEDGEVPVRYDAIEKAMISLKEELLENVPDAVIHMPQFGCGRAGGQFEEILALVEKHWLPHFPVTVFVLDNSQIPV